MKLIIPLMGLLIFTSPVSAQKRQRIQREQSPRQELVYADHAYLPVIRSISFHPDGQENGFPVLYLGAEDPDPLRLSFDDLRGDVRNYYYSIEHCTPEWQSSGLSQLEYADGFNEDRIDFFRSSSGTLQAYTHYQLEIPSRQVRPKLSGNYLLKVYEDADKRRLVLSRRFYVVRPVFELSTQLLPSMDNSKRSKNQKLDLSVQTRQPISNPYQDLRILVMQNARPDVSEWLRKPSFISNTEIRYQDRSTLDFAGGNEFRYVDLRSLRLASERVAAIQTDLLVRVALLPDKNLSTLVYGNVFDENGSFFIRNQDRSGQAEYESDYAQVTFSLDDPDPTLKEGDIYLVGAFNAYHLDQQHRLAWDQTTGTWRVTLPLKQGLYDYEYVFEPSASSAGDKGSTNRKTDPFRFSGSFFQTGNQYQILIYYRRPGTTWDEIWGFREIETKLLP